MLLLLDKFFEVKLIELCTLEFFAFIWFDEVSFKFEFVIKSEILLFDCYLSITESSIVIWFSYIKLTVACFTELSLRIFCSILSFLSTSSYSNGCKFSYVVICVLFSSSLGSNIYPRLNSSINCSYFLLLFFASWILSIIEQLLDVFKCFCP
jgi:hypothetical protein